MLGLWPRSLAERRQALQLTSAAKNKNNEAQPNAAATSSCSEAASQPRKRGRPSLPATAQSSAAATSKKKSTRPSLQEAPNVDKELTSAANNRNNEAQSNAAATSASSAQGPSQPRKRGRPSLPGTAQSSTAATDKKKSGRLSLQEPPNVDKDSNGRPHLRSGDVRHRSGSGVSAPIFELSESVSPVRDRTKRRSNGSTPPTISRFTLAKRRANSTRKAIPQGISAFSIVDTWARLSKDEPKRKTHLVLRDHSLALQPLRKRTKDWVHDVAARLKATADRTVLWADVAAGPNIRLHADIMYIKMQVAKFYKDGAHHLEDRGRCYLDVTNKIKQEIDFSFDEDELARLSSAFFVVTARYKCLRSEERKTDAGCYQLMKTSGVLEVGRKIGNPIVLFDAKKHPGYASSSETLTRMCATTRKLDSSAPDYRSLTVAIEKLKPRQPQDAIPPRADGTGEQSPLSYYWLDDGVKRSLAAEVPFGMPFPGMTKRSFVSVDDLLEYLNSTTVLSFQREEDESSNIIVGPATFVLPKVPEAPLHNVRTTGEYITVRPYPFQRVKRCDGDRHTLPLGLDESCYIREYEEMEDDVDRRRPAPPGEAQFLSLWNYALRHHNRSVVDSTEGFRLLRHFHSEYVPLLDASGQDFWAMHLDECEKAKLIGAMERMALFSGDFSVCDKFEQDRARAVQDDFAEEGPTVEIGEESEGEQDNEPPKKSRRRVRTTTSSSTAGSKPLKRKRRTSQGGPQEACPAASSSRAPSRVKSARKHAAGPDDTPLSPSRIGQTRMAKRIVDEVKKMAPLTKDKKRPSVAPGPSKRNRLESSSIAA
ncbi:unnamed protein product, partial [Mesorhabditis spiculigera]